MVSTYSYRYLNILSLIYLFQIIKFVGSDNISQSNNIDLKPYDTFTSSSSIQPLTMRYLQNSDIDECVERATAKLCATTYCSINGGTCNGNTCACKSGYITKDASSIPCCYKQKSQLTAFLLEFIFSFGFGHFYIGNN